MVTKRCTGCERELPLDDFHRRSTSPDGRQSKCKACKKAWGEEYRPTRKPVEAARYRADPDRVRRSRLGLTRDQHEAMIEAQDNRCAICGGNRSPIDHRSKRKRALAIDHDHATGLVRGLLCQPCNQALGLFQDDPDLLLAAALYLERARGASGEAPLGE